MRPRLLAALSAALVLATGCGGGDGEPDLEVGAAQAALPVAGSSQVVVSITNDGDGDDTLVEADTESALGVEFHLTAIEEGRASMNQLQEVEIPAGEEVRFRPGGLHLMLVVPDDTVTEGGTFDLTLRFERSGEVTVPVEVTDLLELYEDGLDEDDLDDPDGATGG